MVRLRLKMLRMIGLNYKLWLIGHRYSVCCILTSVLGLVAPCSLLLSPAALLLAKAAKQWQEQHGGQLPSSYQERTAFKELVASWQRHVDGMPLDVRVCDCMIVCLLVYLFLVSVCLVLLVMQLHAALVEGWGSWGCLQAGCRAPFCVLQ
jgi:hypothetical protein